MSLQDTVAGGTDVYDRSARALGATISSSTWTRRILPPIQRRSTSRLPIRDGAVEAFDTVTIDKQNNFVEAVVNDEDSGSKMILVKALGATLVAPRRAARLAVTWRWMQMAG
jgi:hypothetical protein